MLSVRETAFAARETNVCVVPTRGNGIKAPASNWREFQARLPTKKEIDVWFPENAEGIGVICGAVSGNLECLDFDDLDALDNYSQRAREVGAGDLFDRVANGYFETTPNGAHLFYRCEVIAGNQKLAKTEDGKAIIETRGERGFAITAPSHGRTHESGDPYILKRGGWAELATITPDERNTLLDIARSFDEYQPTRLPQSGPPSSVDNRPGDEWARETSWAEILQPHGWRKLFTDAAGETYWVRPGKKRGVSASTNYKGTDLLYVFSTSTTFDAEVTHTKFGAYAVLEHNGDFAAAARALVGQGYGESTPADETVELDALLTPTTKRTTPASFPRHLLNVPGLVGDFATFINESSVKPQPILALGASLAAVATIIGQKARTDGDVRSNIYTLGICETGGGKDRAIKAIREVFRMVGCDDELCPHDGFASDAGLRNSLEDHPVQLLATDEIGFMLNALSSAKSADHIRGQVAELLKLYSASDGVFVGKAYADGRKLSVDQPCVSIYGVSTPAKLWESITSDQIENGFLNRFLLFESETPTQLRREVPISAKKPSHSLLAAFRAWYDESKGPGNMGGSASPAPRIVVVADEAKEVFRDLEADMLRRQDALIRMGEPHGLWVRVELAAIKLALIRACGVTHESPRVELADAEWGAQLALYNAERMGRGAATFAADTSTERLYKRAIDWMQTKRRARKSEFTLRFKATPRREREDLLKTLEDAGEVVRAKQQTRGRPCEWLFVPDEWARVEGAA